MPEGSPTAETATETQETPRSGRDRLAEVEARWAAKWADAGLHEADPEPGRPKFFGTYPYSYMNAFAHVGHAYTMSRVDFRARYERLHGKNALFPMGFHVTGTPIVAAAHRVAKEDPVQLRILRESGIPEEELGKFADPHHWIAYFPDKWREDITRFGMMIDWRRSFITTDKNPYYDRFIKWQFLRLKEKGYVRKGRHPVIWDPVQKAVIGDHDRAEGEGVAPQEGVLLKFPIEGRKGHHLIAATLRPETVFGQTNLWVDPSVDYVELAMEVKSPEGDTKKEHWIASRECAEKLRLQDLGVKTEVQSVSGKDLVGLVVTAPGAERKIPVLPASFMKTDKWTGIVTSVPSDAPLDFVALQDLKKDPAPLVACGADPALLETVAPIEIIDTEELGTLPAKAVVEKLKIQSQKDDERLKQATEEVYQAAFYKGRMLPHCGPVAGRPVSEAKEAVKEWLLAQGSAHLMWEPESLVVSRHGHQAVVKVVSDQWFLAYGDKEWKATTHEAFDRMEILPEVARKQFHIVVDWLRDWACTREAGLGTRLPWDEDWLIESLSDSTVYMAYYTVSHHLERLKPPADDLSPEFWDHIMLGKGDAEAVATKAVPVDEVKRMRAEFDYWYPLDFRNSGKDLLQNHLTFAVFNHCALFPEEKWMQGIAVNGWVTVDGEKMSKSKGNFITLRDAMERFGVSETRFAVASAGEGLDDANFEIDVAKSATRRLVSWLDNMMATWDRVAKAEDGEERGADRWFASVLNRTLQEVDGHMSRAEYRTALKVAYHDLGRDWSWYLKRTGDDPLPSLARQHVSAQTRLLAVFVPHLAEEVWHHIDGTGSVLDAGFPAADPTRIDPAAERQETYFEGVLDDIRNILKIIGKEPTKVYLYTAPEWKRRADGAIAAALEALPPGERVNPGTIIKALVSDPELKAHTKDVPKHVNLALKQGAGFLNQHRRVAGVDETAALKESQDFLTREFNAEVAVFSADDPDKVDPAGRAQGAVPGRPAVYVE
ncbi:MAG: leucine--tRNA ligase [Euryarchaeota archaeon]|nr:leucine--tRNA ligase [Euryarchaeota archaeon]